jgi:hypothetical protein
MAIVVAAYTQGAQHCVVPRASPNWPWYGNVLSEPTPDQQPSSFVHLVAASRSHDVRESIFAIKEDLARLLVAGFAAFTFVFAFRGRGKACLLGNGVPHLRNLTDASCSISTAVAAVSHGDVTEISQGERRYHAVVHREHTTAWSASLSLLRGVATRALCWETLAWSTPSSRASLRGVGRFVALSFLLAE